MGMDGWMDVQDFDRSGVVRVPSIWISPSENPSSEKIESDRSSRKR